ncbi:MAG: disulfide bond formation protein B [Pseudomonadota bacterium]
MSDGDAGDATYAFEPAETTPTSMGRHRVRAMSAPDASDFQASAPSQRGWILLAGAGSATVFLAALGYQYLGGLLPCAMCLWQRWPHRIAMALTLIGVLRPSNGIVALGVASMLVSAGLGVFHTGVERSWWEGPQSCAATASQDLGAMSGAELLDFTTGPQIVMCDEVAWTALGLSMASWNALLSLVLAAFWACALMRGHRLI